VDGAPQRDAAASRPPERVSRIWVGRAVSGEAETFCHGQFEDLLVLPRALRPEEARALSRHRR
jgi:hypothetical protein